MSFGHIVNFAINFSALLIVVMLLVAVLMSGNRRQPVFRTFLLMLLLTIAVLMSEWLIALLMGRTTPFVWVLIRTADFASQLLYALMAASYILFLYRYLRQKAPVSPKPFYLAACLNIGTVTLVVVNLFHPIFAHFDENNYYVVQSTFWISEVFPILVQIVNFSIIAHHRKLLNFRERICFSLYLVIHIACMVVETLVLDVWLSSWAAAFTLFMIYINMQADMREQLRRQDAELVESRVAIMLSQIQPHFLYNTLSAIDRLCYDKPEAHKAILTFSEYLRVNMDSLTQKNLIPFEKELEHTRQYLWLEELRFEERLHVAYDIETDEFLLPALTLQPLVENAVRYGVTKKPQGGRIAIRAEQMSGGHRVIVSDDGVGFAPGDGAEDGRSHIGIDNVRARLSAMCGGKLTIVSVPGEGTTATIDIPDQGRAR